MNNALWFDVETGDVLTVEITGSSGANQQFAGGTSYVPDMGAQERWPASKGKHEKTFSAGSGNATVLIDVHFLATTRKNAKLTAYIKKADGTYLKNSSGSNRFTHTFSGKKGDGRKYSTLVVIRK